jgi:hypothetical protein
MMRVTPRTSRLDTIRSAVAAATCTPTSVLRSRRRRVATGRTVCHTGANPNTTDDTAASTMAARMVRALNCGVRPAGAPVIASTTRAALPATKQPAAAPSSPSSRCSVSS